MKIEAKQRLTARYRGESGTYISVVPDTAGVAYISRYLTNELDGRYSQPAELHATVAYSKQVLTPLQQLAVTQLAGPDRKFVATASHLTAWVGHNGEVYLVMKFDCPELEALNSDLQTRFKLTGNFPVFKLHVTLVTDLRNATPPFNEVKLSPVKVVFTGLRIEDAK